MSLKTKEPTALSAIVLVLAILAFLTSDGLANTAPQFVSVSPQAILEGNNLNLTITATDVDNDPISIVAISRPSVSSFVDNGDGTANIQWQPDYAGPNSSEGSPFILSFMATDGSASSQINITIFVVNNNRVPVINPVSLGSYTAGDLVSIEITGSDADSDPLSWNLLLGPSGIDFSSGTSAELSWQTVYADSGKYNISVELSDSYGAKDTIEFVLDIEGKTIYELSIGMVEAFPAEMAKLPVYLANLEEVSGFNLLISYDISALFLSRISVEGTRAESFEYITYVIENNNIKGDVLAIGVADLDNGVTTGNLPAGSGTLMNITFYVTNDLSFSGYSIPVRFAFRNLIEKLDNTLTDANDETIAQEAISYNNGFVAVKSVDINSIGDINLNGVKFEIADAIYFINYFIDPGSYPLSPEQRANTDVNRDGLTASIADLVYLINYLSNPNIAGKPISYPLTPVAVSTSSGTDNFSLSLNSEVEIGGLILTLESGNRLDSKILEDAVINADGMKQLSSIDKNIARILIYGEDRIGLRAGVNNLLTINKDNSLRIKDIEISSVDGVLLKTITGDAVSGILPDGYSLDQNYPNPFNPATEIKFTLPAAAKVNLTVYNLLGQEVKTLIETTLPTGIHTVVWDGKNDQGSTVSSGIYFYRLLADGFEARRKMILMK